jgi:hypothetical protein
MPSALSAHECKQTCQHFLVAPAHGAKFIECCVANGMQCNNGMASKLVKHLPNLRHQKLSYILSLLGQAIDEEPAVQAAKLPMRARGVYCKPPATPHRGKPTHLETFDESAPAISNSAARLLSYSAIFAGTVIAQCCSKHHEPC